MRLAIMQPYFFPYLGYFDLINRVDQWVVFDIVDYSKRSWMNRNRILHPDTGWQYISVPILKSTSRAKICDVELVNKLLMEKTMLSQLGHYKKSAPFYREVIQLIRQSFALSTTNKLSALNIAALGCICRYLDIDFNCSICSELDLSLPDNCLPGQWAVEISDLLGAKEYYNPVGGVELFAPEDFSSRGIALKFINTPEFSYDCNDFSYESNMSIIDLLMWNHPEQIKSHLDLSKNKFL